jgi:hypothetical protein
VLSVLLVASMLQAGPPGGDTIPTLVRVERLLRRVGRSSGASIWSGYRPDTIPLMYVFPERGHSRSGSLLMRWTGAPPQAYAAVAGAAGVFWLGVTERGASNTNSSLGNRAVAQVVVDTLDAPALLPISAHEAFHVFERASRVEGKRFGVGENSGLTGSYPVFDSTNEAGFAREGALLARALRARSAVDVLTLAKQFVAVREARHAALPKDLAAFDAAAELNEGLADYAQIRAAQSAGKLMGGAWAKDATSRYKSLLVSLDSLIDHPERSVRLRYYRTGTAMALLLDRLGPGWKPRMVANDWTIQQALAHAVGYDTARSAKLLAAAETATGGPLPMQRALHNIARLRELRRIQVDSVLSQPGLKVIIQLDSLPNKGHSLCGFDPQNMLSTGGPRLLHTRFVHPCEQTLFDAVFTTAAVHDYSVNTLTAVLPVSDTVRLSVGGVDRKLGEGESFNGVADFELDSRGLTVRAKRAVVQRSRNELRIRPLGP